MIEISSFKYFLITGNNILLIGLPLYAFRRNGTLIYCYTDDFSVSHFNDTVRHFAYFLSMRDDNNSFAMLTDEFFQFN